MEKPDGKGIPVETSYNACGNKLSDDVSPGGREKKRWTIWVKRQSGITMYAKFPA